MGHSLRPSYLCHRFDILLAEDDVQKVVSVSVDGRESQMVFVDHAHADMSVSLVILITGRYVRLLPRFS